MRSRSPERPKAPTHAARVTAGVPPTREFSLGEQATNPKSKTPDLEVAERLGHDFGRLAAPPGEGSGPVESTLLPKLRGTEPAAVDVSQAEFAGAFQGRQGSIVGKHPLVQLQDAEGAIENRTGLPDRLKMGLERLSGLDLSGVRVHYNSAKPAQLNAFGYTQGRDIHVGPSREQHLPHEGWHAVQQMQGRVKPTIQTKGVSVNDDATLEHEADVMGAKALRVGRPAPGAPGSPAHLTIVQRREAETPEASGNGGADVRPVVQRRYDFERFSSYAQAKNATQYARELLDTQTGAIENYVGRGFSKAQIEEIYRINAKAHGGQISSDNDGTPLARQDTSVTPHIDHRFPKSKGGSNTYVNAQILPASVNISKGNKTEELSEEPDTPLKAYESLAGHSAFSVDKLGAFHEFTSEQREAIKAANTSYYGGSLTSDGNGTTVLLPIDSSQVPNIDHIVPKSGGGSNFYFNAAVLPMNENITKGGVRGGGEGVDELDYEIGAMNLKKYYREKRRLNYKKTPTPPTREQRLDKARKDHQEQTKNARRDAVRRSRQIVNDD